MPDSLFPSIPGPGLGHPVIGVHDGTPSGIRRTTPGITQSAAASEAPTEVSA